MPERTVTLRINAQDSFSDVMRNYQSAMGRAADNTKKFQTDATSASNSLGDRTRGLVSRIGNLNNMVNAAAAAFAGVKILGLIGDLNNLGREAAATQRVFNQLIGNLGSDADDALRTLRTATRGVVDDMTLMTSTNRLVQMGLAGSVDEAATLSEMAVTLGGALGKDAGSAMEEFALLLANQSIPRLDTFGISAGAVRTRIAELKAETPGLTREQAFLTATMEQGRMAMENLGTAADASASAYARLGTRIQNAKQDVGEFVATGVESGAFIGESLVTIVDQAFGGTAEFNDPLRGITDEFTLRLIEQTEAALQASQQELLLGSRITGRESRFLTEGGDPLTEAIAAVLTGNREVPEGLSPEMQEIIHEYSRIQANAIFDEAEAEAAAVAAQRQRIERAPLTLFGGADITPDRAMGGASLLGQGMGSRFLADRQAADVANRRERAPLMIMQQMTGEADRLSGAMQLAQSRGQRFADEMRRAADETARARQDAEAMSLAAIFGTTGGGRLGELTDVVAGNITDEEARARFERAADLASGRETAASLFTSERLAPAISELAQTDPEAAATAIQNFNRVLTELELAGFDPNSAEVLNQGLALAGIGRQAPQEVQVGRFTITAGGQGEVGLTEGFSAEDLVDNLDVAKSHAEEISRIFEQEIDGPHDVRLEVEVVDKNGDLAFLKDLTSGGLGDLMAQATQANGGVPPGTDMRRFTITQ